MHVNKRILTRFTNAYLKNMVFVLLIFSLEASVFAVTCLEHLVGHAHQDHHTLFTPNPDQNTPALPGHTHRHNPPTKSSKGLECHLTEGRARSREKHCYRHWLKR